MSRLTGCLPVVLILLLGACASRHEGPVQDLPPPSQPRYEPTPQAEPLATRGNHSPYRVHGETYYVLPSAHGYNATGIASWYGSEFHGRPTSSGETYDMYAYTAAHRSLPLPSYARVTNLDNGRSVTVRINDRGPFKRGRVIDLSYAAARKLNMIDAGTVRVKVEVLATKDPTEVRPQVASADHVYLQIAAFSQRSNALALIQRLRAHKLKDAEIQTVTRPDGATFHRVRLGPLINVEAAESLTQQITELGLSQPTMIFE